MCPLPGTRHVQQRKGHLALQVLRLWTRFNSPRIGVATLNSCVFAYSSHGPIETYPLRSFLEANAGTRNGTWCQVPPAKSQFQVPSSKFQVPSPKFQVPSSKSQVPSSKFQFQVPSSKFQVPSSKHQVPSSTSQIPSPKSQAPSSKFQVDPRYASGTSKFGF